VIAYHFLPQLFLMPYKRNVPEMFPLDARKRTPVNAPVLELYPEVAICETAGPDTEATPFTNIDFIVDPAGVDM
jgi:hypothetical protein